MAGEGKLQAYCKAQCKSHEVYWRKIKFEGQVGCPDTLMVYEGHVVFIEFKNPNGSGATSKMQDHQIKELRDHGAVALVINSYEGVDDVIKRLTE